MIKTNILTDIFLFIWNIAAVSWTTKDIYYFESFIPATEFHIVIYNSLISSLLTKKKNKENIFYSDDLFIQKILW